MLLLVGEEEEEAAGDVVPELVLVLALTRRSPCLGGLCLTTMGMIGVCSSVVILLIAEESRAG